MDLNKAFILGRVTQDPQAKNLPSGMLVANFGIATNRVFYDKNREKQKQTEFHNIVAFGKPAEIIQQYLKRGSLVLIEGRIQTRNWEDKDGIKKYRTEIIVENLQLGPKSQNQTSDQNYNPAQAQTEKKPEITNKEIPTIEEDYNPAVKKEENEEIDVKDLPL